MVGDEGGDRVGGRGSSGGPARRALPPLPGLDGLRGLAVLAVLAYHSGADWARGGWLGVSAFFTLSGFLITTLLLAEVGERGRISLPAFAGRRARRLLPALVATVAGVVVASRWFALPSTLVHLRGDAWATLGQVANWRFLARGQGYGAQFESASPLLHVWSLSIEAQAYVLLPLVVIGAAWWARSRRRDVVGTVAAALVALFVLSLGAGAALAESGVSIDRLYFGTDVRLVELLAGGLLAVLLHRRPLERLSGEARQALDVAGVVVLLLGLGVWAVADQADRGLYPIGLWAHALGAAVVVAAVRAGGVTARTLAVRPLQVIGRMSYGIYLYHWPIFTWLTPERSGWPAPAVHATRLALTFALAAVSLRLLEDPIRRRRGLLRGSRPWLAPVALGAAAALALTVNPPRSEERIDIAATADQLEELTATTSSVTVPEGEPEPPKFTFVGDSTALVNGLGVATWAGETGRMVALPGIHGMGCGLLPGREHRMEVAPFTHSWECPTWTDIVDEGVGSDLVVVSFGPWEMADHLIPGHGWSHLGDPVVDEAMRREIEVLSDAIIDAGMAVVWLLPPRMIFGTRDGVLPTEDEPSSDPARLERFRELIEEEVADRPGQAATIDLRTYLEGLPGGELDTDVRPDLIHFNGETAREMAEWMGPEILAIAADLGLPRDPP